MSHIDFKLEEEFVRHYLKRIIERGKGIGYDGEWCSRIKPQRTYFIGSLAAKREQESLERRRMDERYSPNSCGIEFRVKEKKGYVQVACSFSVYVFSFAPYDKLQKAGDRVYHQRHYKRYRVEFESEIVSIQELLCDLKRFAIKWTENINNAIAQKLTDSEFNPYTIFTGYIKEHKSVEDIEIPISALVSEVSYLEFIKNISSGKPYCPDWRIELEIDVKDDLMGERIRIFLKNITPEPDTTIHLDLDAGIYGAELSCECIGFKPIPILLNRSSQKDYRYQFVSHGRGINCSLSEEQTSENHLVLKADFAPYYEQKRYLPEEKGYQLLFQDLSEDPISPLEPIIIGMELYAKEWNERIINKEDGIQNELDETKARSYLAQFNNEIERFKNGIDSLKRAESLGRNLHLAFQLMNATFEQLDRWRMERVGKRYYGWRMFQLIFIVSNMQELLNRAEGNADNAPVELLFFPTGGGKTEAMMGIVVTAMFFDRLRGRTRGVTSWMRFPLRLLTFQQMQRYIDIIAAAEIIRESFSMKYPQLLQGDPFKIGYYGGSDNSPNDLYKFDGHPDWLNKVATDMSQESGYKVMPREVTGFDVLTRYPEAFQKYKMVGDCPFCGALNKVEIVADEESISLRHKCSSCERILPIVIVDSDIYSAIPSILVGTLDKIANIGFRLGTRTLFGKADGKCDKHGYGTFGKCLKHRFGKCNNSNWKKFKDENPIDPAISICFQDELHLLNEELGCFDAHYEATLDALCQDAGSLKPKILAASATIEGAENQVDHLYRRPLNIFPGEGPQLRETFYAKEQEKLLRIFCGLKPSGMQPLDMSMILIGTIALENDLLQKSRIKAQSDAEYDFLYILDEQDYKNLIDRHCLIVPYVNSKPDGAQIERSIEEQVQDMLSRNGASPVFPPEMLTGDTEMPEVKAILKRMETPSYMVQNGEQLDIVICTSMISHGVDIDRLNTMVFYSFPRSTAEYIQATSRAGRTYPGLVFDILKASSQRDRSYFRHFGEVHYALDQMVEAVPIDRFAANAADRTVPGVALACLLGSEVDKLRKENKLSLNDARQLDNASTLRRLVAMEEGILKDILYRPLCTIYDVYEPQGAHFAETINSTLFELEHNLAKVDENAHSIPYALNFSTTRVMTSLRDVDPGVAIEIEERVQRK
ncbi:MAG: helicase-related protein [Bacillota bacterium]